MPEGPEVKVVTDWLDLTYRSCVIIDNQRFPEINGYCINHIHCKGKQIFFVLVKQDSSRLYLNARLGMTGRFTDNPTPIGRFWLKLKLTTIDGSLKITVSEKELHYHICYFGHIGMMTNDQYIEKLDQLGPDLLSEHVDYNVWVTKIKNKRIANKQICDFLLEQKYFCGIGNYLKCDILYICKIRPDRPLKLLTDEEIHLLYYYSINIIKQSYSCGGLTIKDFWSPLGKPGLYKTLIYDKEVDKNGYAVVKEDFKDKRTTHWVKEIQK